jgi:hypothetical protein
MFPQAYLIYDPSNIGVVFWYTLYIVHDSWGDSMIADMPYMFI